MKINISEARRGVVARGKDHLTEETFYSTARMKRPMVNVSIFFLSSSVFSFRSSDGVCTAGTVVVSRLKMGEMEEVDVDHITTDIPSQKVE